MADQKQLLDVLPHDLGAYRDLARQLAEEPFERRFPHPFLLFVRNKLWDRSFLSTRAQEGPGGGETRVAQFVLDHSDGLALLALVRRRPGSPPGDRVVLGRSLDNDMVVPISSVSSVHAAFIAPGAKHPGRWAIADLGSTNGTHVNDEALGKFEERVLDDGVFVRLGGNVVAWFLSPRRLWRLLRDDAKLRELTDP